MAGNGAQGHRRKQSGRTRQPSRNSGRTLSSFESLEQRRLLAAITVVVTDPRFAPPGGSRAIANDGQDDAPAIQRAIDYVPQAGNVLLQPNGSNYTVQAGDTIGTVGTNGSSPSPQLHFELRKGATPVDPVPLLAG